MRVLAFSIPAGILSVLIITAAAPARQDTGRIDRAFDAFFSASDRTGAAGRIEAILKTGVSFDDALSRVRHGRAYDADVPRGLQFGRTRTFDGLDHRYAFASRGASQAAAWILFAAGTL